MLFNFIKVLPVLSEELKRNMRYWEVLL